MRYASWSIIIDDIVFPDGRTRMGVLGGGGLYTVAGMRIWSHDVGLLASVGADFDSKRLASLDLRTAGLRIQDRPTARAWQLFEHDGRRTQIPRVATADWQAQLTRPDDFPEWLAQLGVRAFHVLSRGHPADLGLVERLAGMGVRLSMEPIIEDGMDLEQRDRVLACLPYVELFSPGLAEAQALLGKQTPGNSLRMLAKLGPAVVALRMGAAGSLVYGRESQRMLRVPAAPARVVDLTGAGNAYCGGLLVGWVEHGELDTAAAQAAISAARTIEQIGPPAIAPELIAAAQRQLPEVLASVREVEDSYG